MKFTGLAVKFLWFAGCASVCMATMVHQYCYEDVDCQIDNFCLPVSDSDASADLLSQPGLCFPCQNCSALQRQSLRSCEGNGLAQCGSCLDGYQERPLARVDNDSCEPIAMKRNSSFDFSNVTQQATDNDVLVAESSFMTPQVLLLAGIALAALVAAAVSILLGRVYHRRLAKRSYEAVAHLEDVSARKLPAVQTSLSTEPLVYWDANVNFDEMKPSMT